MKGRTEIGNKAKADLFISIHTNSAANTSAKGTETFIYGLEQTGINMEVAKRENSVILLEDDYTTTYQGYDPNSVESFIMFDFQQNKYFEQSIHFASMVQDQFRILAQASPTAVCASKTCWCFAFRPCQAYWSRWDISAIPQMQLF